MRKRDWGYIAATALISGLTIFWLVPKSGHEISRSVIEVANITPGNTIMISSQKGNTILKQLQSDHEIILEAGHIHQIDSTPCTETKCWQLSVDNNPVSSSWLNIDSGNYTLIRLKYETIQN